MKSEIFVVVFQSYLTLCDPMDCTLKDPLSIEFPRQEYWSGYSLLKGIYPSQDQNRVSCIAADSLPSETPGKPTFHYNLRLLIFSFHSHTFSFPTHTHQVQKKKVCLGSSEATGVIIDESGRRMVLIEVNKVLGLHLVFNQNCFLFI